MQYWDTSALLKLSVPEPDSARFSAHVSFPIFASELARWEMLRTIVKKEMEGVLPTGSAEATFQDFLSDVSAGAVVLVPCDAAVETRFRSLVLQLHRRNPPVVIRTIDAIHLATASCLAATELVTTDARMRAAAAVMGLTLFP